MSPGPAERIAPINVSPKIRKRGRLAAAPRSIYYVEMKAGERSVSANREKERVALS